jgi:uncharacterized membrane protein
VVTDEGARPAANSGYPWLWLLPGLLVLAGLILWGIAVYPHLPARIPRHMGGNGIDAYWDKSIGTVFLPVIVQAGVLALLAGTAYGTLRVTPTSELPPGRAVSSLVNRPKTREAARRGARAQLFLAFCLGLTMAAVCTVMWSPTPPAEGEPLTGKLLLALLPLALGTLATLTVAFRDRRKTP